MIRTWKLLCLPALLVVALTASSVRAGDSDKPTLDSKLDYIIKQLAQLQEENARLRYDFAKQQDDNDRRQRLNDQRDEMFEKRLRILENKLEDIEKAAKGRVSNYPPDPSAPSADVLRDLDARMKRLERERTAGTFTPSDTINPPPVATTGVIRIQNLSFNTSLIRINGTTYSVRPGETISTTVPAGNFTYEVLADGRGFPHFPALRALPANEVFTVTLTP